jgi:hypothetical protein
MKAIVCIVLVTLLSGCATVQPVAPTPVHSESKHTFEKNYHVGESKSAYVGEAMLKVKDYYELSSQANLLAASEGFVLTGSPFMHETIQAGTAARVDGNASCGSGSCRVVAVDNRTLMAAGVRLLLNDDGTLEGGGLGMGGARMGWTYKANPPAAKFESKTFTKIDTTKGEKNFELVYGGTTSEMISVLYREYTANDMARPAFSQQLTYAKGSKTIRFRNIQLQVDSADNERIVFTVTADGMD